MSDVRKLRLSPPLRRAFPWIVAAMLLSTVGLPAAAAVSGLPGAPMIGFAHPETANTSATVNMTDRPAFTPRSISATPGETLSLQLVNQGGFDHTFTLSKVPNAVLSSSWSPSEVNSFFAKNGSFANVTVGPGSTGWANVSFNTSVGGDSFEFVSVVPYQFQSGMWGFVNMTVTGPGVELQENTTDSYAFVPAVLAANSTHYPMVIDVLVTNQGNLGHTFTVSPLSNYSLSPANFTQTFLTNTPLVSQPIGSGVGTSVWANLTVQGPGVYQYICTITGHFANGMTGYLYVGITPPPPPPPVSTAIVQEWVLVGSGVLLGIGALVAVIAAYVGRFPAPPSGEHRKYH